ncbi:hypothetical protein [Caenispirillum bisanense]|uniref:Uncharacterized protein n=1 Tax=Caenispirillum bisanense TaxID=414052 RepID=A0A286G2P3_9PROT|nr:hypothetical protein [Caenispirillum bisanense]SOD89743.1 hypothetical protein SAMN05421508_101320 [Caenispirillum bisanense]
MTVDGPDRMPPPRAVDLRPVGEILRRPPRRPAAAEAAAEDTEATDALPPWRRRLLLRTVGWLARRFAAAAEASAGEPAHRYAGYVALLRRIEGDLALVPASGHRRGHLTVVGED